MQKIIRLKGISQVVELGQSVQRAAQPKTVKETVLVPERIVAQKRTPVAVKPVVSAPTQPVQSAPPPVPPPATIVTSQLDVSQLKVILARLEGLRKKWDGLDLKNGQ